MTLLQSKVLNAFLVQRLVIKPDIINATIEKVIFSITTTIADKKMRTGVIQE